MSKIDMRIYIGSDHRGFRLKATLLGFLQKKSYRVFDVGNSNYDTQDDYPDFGKKVALAVKKNPSSRGIAICGSGAGMCIAANRIRGIRAVLALDTKIAMASRRDDDTNVLCLSSDFTTPAKAKRIALAWLHAEFSSSKKHIRRVKKLDQAD